MAKNRVAIHPGLLLSAMALLLAAGGCRQSNPVDQAERKAESLQKPASMTPDSSVTSSRVPVTGAVNYAALGDSTGAGVGARDGGYVARLFKRVLQVRPGSRLTNLCFSGATTSDVLRAQLNQALAADPNLVTLGIGINDIGHGVSLDEFGKNYEEILGKLRNNTKAEIVVTNIPDISSAPRIPQLIRDEYQRLIVEFNRKLDEIAARHGVTVFDVYTITHEQLPGHPEFFSDDGFHPSDKGYELWAEKMWPTIASTIGVDSG